MNNLKKFALQPTSTLHLRDGADELMYADGPDGKPDESKPMQIRLFGPGTKKFHAAKARASNRSIDRVKKKGKSDQSAEEQLKETAEFLAECTDGFENIEVDDLTGEALYKAVYADAELCFIAKQVDMYLGETANFTKSSTPT